jgi:hypothetical protein
MSSNSRSQDWSTPPEGILLRILSLADTRIRLKAALVSSHWAKTAAAATKEVTCRPRHSTVLDQYLGKHGQHVTSLSIEADRVSDREAAHLFLIKQLPCPNLLNFDFRGLGGQLLPAGGTPHLQLLLQAVTGLTRIRFEMHSEVPGFCPSLSLLTDLKQLRSLRVEVCSDREEDDPPVQPQDRMDGAILAQL